jgi:hypothetical protein
MSGLVRFLLVGVAAVALGMLVAGEAWPAGFGRPCQGGFARGGQVKGGGFAGGGFKGGCVGGKFAKR